jgi:hypothetical protein
VQAKTNHTPHAYDDSVQINFWNGLTQVRGYHRIRFLDATFYRHPEVAGASWDSALTHAVNAWYAVLSRRLTNWKYAASRVTLAPFAWIDGTTDGPEYERARSPQYVAEQLNEFAKWSPGGNFAIYSSLRLGTFDYQPYASGMRQAARATPTPTTRDPKLEVKSSAARVKVHRLSLRGTTHDELAIKVVRWATSRKHGTAELDWKSTGGNLSDGLIWRTHWSISNLRVPRAKSRLTISVEDIAGRVSTVRLRVNPKARHSHEVRLVRG